MNEVEIGNRLDVENIRLASVERRSFAYLIDEVVVTVLFAVVIWGQVADITSPEQIMAYSQQYLPYILVAKVLYQAIFVYMYGATLGKLALKIRVVEVEYFGLPTVQQAIIRAVMRLVSEMLFYVGFVVALFSPIKLTWHDRFSKTIVIDV